MRKVSTMDINIFNVDKYVFQGKLLVNQWLYFFYHPDFTVGNGISPSQSRILQESRTFTAGREFQHIQLITLPRRNF